MAVWQCTGNFYARPNFSLPLCVHACCVCRGKEGRGCGCRPTYCSCTGGQGAVGEVGVGEVRDHEERIAGIVRALEEASILLPPQGCGHIHTHTQNKSGSEQTNTH